MTYPYPHTGEGSAQIPHADQPLLLGRYRIVERRGSGGFSSVLVCWDSKLERKVAVKCMPLTSNPNYVASTVNEAMAEALATSKLNHPNIVTLHDYEIVDDVAYLIMEYVEGFTLAELMARVEGGVLTYDECAHLLDSLASALDYAHNSGVLHLDIKPSNVFIDMGGTFKLGDFGMASIASAAGWEGARGGTVGYMPPEQLRGEMVDERTDVFALGVLCYQALTGETPFAAADADASLKKINKGAKALAKIDPSLKGPISDSINRALSPEPAGRQTSAGELNRAVLPYMGDEIAGRESIASLMKQAKDETGPKEDAWIDAAHIRLIARFPKLPAICTRLTCAAVFAAIGARFVPGIVSALSIDLDTTTVFFASLGIFALLGAIKAEITGLLAGVVCVCALLATGIYSPVFLVAVLVAALLLLWRYFIMTSDDLLALDNPLAHAALFLATATGSPLGAAALSGFVLTPARAGATSVTSALLCFVMTQIGAGNGSLVSSACATLVLRPSFWIVLLGCAISAWLVALFMRFRRAGVRIFGQILGSSVLIFFQLIALRVENGGLWVAPALIDIVVALTCLVFMSIAIGVLGPAPMPQEDD